MNKKCFSPFSINISFHCEELLFLDEKEQCSSLNLLIGYINIFGKYKFNHVLQVGNQLETLFNTLIHISKFENGGPNLVEDVSIHGKNCSKTFFFV